jgi:hypothetical protein
LARRLEPPANSFAIELGYAPTAENRPRWGYGRPPHERMRAVLSHHDDEYRQNLELIAGYRDELLAFDLHHGGGLDPCWLNAWLLGLDTASIYGLIRSWAPARYVEVGSGFSTMVVARAKRDGGLPTTITSIDPHPRAGIDALCQRVIRQPLESTDLGVFADLRAGDVAFYDGSHRVFTNSDTTVFYLEVLPELAPGVLVGIHDILWPDDYLPEWADYWFSEQYLLGAYLLAETPWLTPLLACNYVSGHPDLSKVLDPLWKEPALTGLDPRGFCVWFRKGS